MEHIAEPLLVPCSGPVELIRGLSFLAIVSRAPYIYVWQLAALSLLHSHGGCVRRYAIKKKDELERVAKANR